MMIGYLSQVKLLSVSEGIFTGGKVLAKEV